ncbi:uncharacterized protein UTRI_03008 [Ustilago trichophora]|uniref:Zn(2)-C6 fungal-type domain-containing protein n=1 Tax=Ustilago trichophora TaxID=86804 RepID=A0A5C3E4K4_9BASI|nr:uncharacterized protein UTRI_03008 [Ustilago trichophora]
MLGLAQSTGNSPARKRKRTPFSPSISNGNDSDGSAHTSHYHVATTQAIEPSHQAEVNVSSFVRNDRLDSSVDSGIASLSSSGSANSGKHRCDICSKTFARHEHLLRHRASHTDTASYSCDECGKRFRRSDVLQRHRRLHVARTQLSLDVNHSKLSKRQKSALARVEAACLRCSSQKLKCDAQRPSCSRCARKAGATCVYVSSSAEPSPALPDTRNRSPSIIDHAWMPADSSANLDFTVSQDDSPIATSTPFSALPSALPPDIDPPSGLVAGSSIDSSAHLPADTLPAQNPHSNQQPFPEQRVRFPAPPIPTSVLPASTYFPAQVPSNAQRSNLDDSSLPQQVIGTTPSLVDAAHYTASDFNTTCVPNHRMLTDLLDWLDGPKSVDTAPAGQIDWIFGDSPEAPLLLDWSQMQDWTNFDLATVPVDDLVSSAHRSTPVPPDHQQQDRTTLQQRHASITAPREHQSPLYMLSSAAEMIQVPQGSLQTQFQHPTQPHASNTARPATSPRVGSDTLAKSVENAHGGAAGIETRAIAGRRSRWNSPELADEDALPSDPARSDELNNVRDDNETEPHTHATSLTDLPPIATHQAKSSTGRRAAAREAWPNRWNPAIKLNSLPSFAFVKASEEHLMSEDMAYVERVSNNAMLRMTEHLRNVASNPLEHERFDATFATLDAATLNVYLQLFFTHCYSYLPAIHQVTFHPDRCDPRLLAALCAVGAFFSEVPGSRNAAVYLASIVQMSVSRATLANNALARVTSTFQAIMLIYMVWRSVGVPSRQEYAEAFRGTYCTMVRRCRLLEDIQPPRLPADATIENRWAAWIAWESGRRTAWSILVSETELSLHWNLPEPFAPNELTGKLPCDDRLWEAPSAVEWAQTAIALSSIESALVGNTGLPACVDVQDTLADFMWPNNSRQLDVAQVCDVIQRTAQSQPPGHPSTVTETEKETIAKLSPFSRLCVGSAVVLSTHHAMKMARFCSMLLGDEEQARERMSKYLAAATDLLSFNQARDARVDLLLHAIQLFELISPEILQLLSCRRGVSRMHAARQGLARELNETKPWKTESIVFHAGQMLCLAKLSLQRAPVECLHIFYAAIALQAVSSLVLQRHAQVSPGQIVRITLNGAPGSAATQTRSSLVSHYTETRQTRTWRADASAPGTSSTSPSSVGGGATHSTSGTSIAGTTPSEGRWPSGSPTKTTFMLESVGNLAHPMAPERVLSLASKWLRADNGVGVWPIGQSLAKILDSLATLNPPID